MHPRFWLTQLSPLDLDLDLHRREVLQFTGFSEFLKTPVGCGPTESVCYKFMLRNERLYQRQLKRGHDFLRAKRPSKFKIN